MCLVGVTLILALAALVHAVEAGAALWREAGREG